MKKKPGSLKQKILIFLILCWGVPIAVFFAFTTISYRRGIIEKAERLMEDELQNVAAFTSARIGDAITLCQRPSYEKTWETSWENLQDGKCSEAEYLQEVNSSLKGKFYLDERFNMYAFYRYGHEDPECFSSRAGISYKSYIEEIQPEIKDIIDMDTSYAYVRVVEGRIFIIRNLYTTVDYKRYGTLVVELNKNKVFQDVPADVRDKMAVCIGSSSDVVEFTDGETKDEKWEELSEELLTRYDGISNRKIDKIQNESYNGYLYQKRYDNYHIGVIIFAKKSEIYSSLYEFYTIAALMLALFIPLFGYGVFFLRKHIQVPIEWILKACKQMEEGEIGISVAGGKMPNSEFQYMKESFDSMSAQVKYLFDYAYDEKLARKDAQIQALQAQINPHFLNNTLEMMNWQARMSGNTIVSKMIEALGTVLDYRMNRANVKEIHLAEELQCIDAYFYIMTMRFGQRLQVERNIEEDLLYIMVPPLILQPIVENAIVHGIETLKNGKISLRVYHDAENVYLEVRNTAKKMTEEDRDRIQAILAGDEDKIPKDVGRHTSIGIRNVNQRIHLVYGEEYGLTIVQEENLETVSTIMIPYREWNEETLLKKRNAERDEWKNTARLNK